MVTCQVVKVAVLNCEPSRERMLLSFKLLSDPERKNGSVERRQKSKKAISVGQVPILLTLSYLEVMTNWVLPTRRVESQSP